MNAKGGFLPFHFRFLAGLGEVRGVFSNRERNQLSDRPAKRLKSLGGTIYQPDNAIGVTFHVRFGDIVSLFLRLKPCFRMPPES